MAVEANGQLNRLSILLHMGTPGQDFEAKAVKQPLRQGLSVFHDTSSPSHRVIH